MMPESHSSSSDALLRWPTLLLSSGLTMTIAIAFGDGLFRMIYGALGQSVGDPAWNYIQVLYGVLGVGSLAVGLGQGWAYRKKLRVPRSKAGWITQDVAVLAAGALFGFANLGRALALVYSSLNQPELAVQWEKDAKVAIVGACLGAVLALGLLWGRRRWDRQLRLQVVFGVMTYGAAFLCSAIAGNFLSLQQSLLGGSLLMLAILYFFCTIVALRTCFRLIYSQLIQRNLPDAQRKQSS
ncbi:hypothetical protein ACN4EG_08125 [Alkalinema pantanalense CENA528]|uniref:hypothetical protein n=1 Tax=Alkalinema pantanalense TaxID=1620705 RepID=UPI003D6DC10F